MAAKKRKRLVRKGWAVYVESRSPAGELVWKLHAGPFADRARADTELAALIKARSGVVTARVREYGGQVIWSSASRARSG